MHLFPTHPWNQLPKRLGGKQRWSWVTFLIVTFQVLYSKPISWFKYKTSPPKLASLFPQEEAKTSDTTEESSTTLTEEQAAIKIQASFRGYKTRKEINLPKEESDEKDEKDEKDKKDEKEEPTEPDKKEPEEPDKKEPEQAQ